ncbi:hypothetical protein GCM10009681_22210 [Luedemannella helvata]|uniref:CAAX prenyl protease 2/Lysostaphin resistance protein A-like domain-containing protein n=1 Tax=Luedemannella helvata TaxID=349315 RepID=A0ABP4WES1_9ACTN
MLIAGLAAFGGALVGLVLTGHRGLRPSADSTDLIGLDDALVPALVGLLLVRLVPLRLPTLDAMPGMATATAIRQAWQLVAIAAGLPIALYVALLLGAPTETVGGVWALSKVLVFVLLTWGLYRDNWLGTPDLWSPRGGWRWWGPLPALAAFALLTSVGPFAGSHPDAADYPDPAVLALAATITFFTANVAEELFYRVILQTRLEAALGRWPAIVAGALLFALLHLPTHGQTASPLGGLPVTLAAIVVFQGTAGLFLGYLWSRYRNAWAQIAAHTIINTLPLAFL